VVPKASEFHINGHVDGFDRGKESGRTFPAYDISLRPVGIAPEANDLPFAKIPNHVGPLYHAREKTEAVDLPLFQLLRQKMEVEFRVHPDVVLKDEEPPVLAAFNELLQDLEVTFEAADLGIAQYAPAFGKLPLGLNGQGDRPFRCRCIEKLPV
jgi:hypothetical protein